MKTRPQLLAPLTEMGCGELETLRLLLTGSSVIDWPHLFFRARDEVDRFLHLLLFDLSERHDAKRLRDLAHKARDYLVGACDIEVPRPLVETTDLRLLFLLASRALGSRAAQKTACMLLKCMRILHHLEAHELANSIALPEVKLAAYVDRRVRRAVTRMQRAGLPLVSFTGSPKSRWSQITKLLVKKETVAAQIVDRLRYRLIIERHEQLAPLLIYLTENIFPFCNVMPGESENRLLDFAGLTRDHPLAIGRRDGQLDSAEQHFKEVTTKNTSTARGFHSLKFVVELPVRVDECLIRGHRPIPKGLGRTLLPLVEFQVVDRATARQNESGAAAHARYKSRQIHSARRRLSIS